MTWPTKEKDIRMARLIMDEYAEDSEHTSLGLFELVFHANEKQLSFRLAHWVLVLVHQFSSMYGAEQGDYVTRQVIGYCMTEGQTLH